MSTYTESIIDYTIVPSGLRIEGQIWTGQATTFTDLCPKCGRVGVISALQHNKQIIVHTGRAVGDRLDGVDYCKHLIPIPADAEALLLSHSTQALPAPGS